MPEVRTCSQCGAPLASDAPEGFCPACALQGALELATFETHQPDPPPGHRTVVLPVTEKPGDRIGRYKLLQQIGEGGCGVVYMAEQEEPVRRRVALKVIKLGMDTRQVIARFEAERQALALMDHPNIAKVLDAGATETGRPFFVMELVRGIKITDYCDDHQLSTPERLDLFIQVCQAIQHAHQKGVIHRDIKPSNILVSLHDTVPVPKVIDFGIAKATADQRLTDKTLFTAFGQFIGTPAYMSPEQALVSGLDVDTRSDIYSLGVLLYELLTGKTPFDATELQRAGLDEIRRTIREKEPLKPSTRLGTMLEGELTHTAKHRHTDAPKLIHSLRGDLDWIVMKCLEKDRARRYETANGLAQDIQRHLGDEPVEARSPGRFYRFRKLVRRNQLAFAAAGAVAGALMLGLGLSTWLFLQEKRARGEAESARQNEATQRGQAVAARNTAQAEARRANDAEHESKIELSTSDFLQAVRLIAEGERRDALAYLVRSIDGIPTNEVAVTRLATLLTHYLWMRPTLILNYTNSVTCAQFSPDGSRILTAPWGHAARVWDARSGQPLTALFQHDGWVGSAQFSPDGKQVVTASSDHTARVWDAQSGQPLTAPLQHDDSVLSAQFSPDGAQIVTASGDFKAFAARVWDARSGQPLTEPLIHSNRIYSAQFSPDGKRIVTASWDHTARVWDARNGQPLTKPLKHSGWVDSAEFSPDGTRIVTASHDQTARVWDAQTGQPVTKPLKHGSFVKSAHFSPNGKRIVTASYDNTARVWDAQSGLQLLEPLKHNGWVDSARFSPDGMRIVTAAHDQTARLWDARSGQPLTEPLNHNSAVNSAQFSPDGRRIVTASNDRTVRVWDLLSGQPLIEPLKHGGFVSSAQFSPDGNRIVTASSDHTARVWDSQTSRPLTDPMPHDGRVKSAQFSSDGKQIVTASEDHTARVWDSHSGQLLTAPLKHNHWVMSAQFSPDGKKLVTASMDQTARVWDAETGRPLTEPLKHADWVMSAQFSPDGKRIVTASFDLTARVWDAQTGQPLTEPLKHSREVTSAQFSPDGKRIVTVASDQTARVWDARTGQPLTEPMTHNDNVNSAQFSPDGKRIVTASRDRTARVWDALNGQPLTEPLKHNGEVNAAYFNPGGNWIVTTSDDQTARVWDAFSGQPLTDPLKHNGRVTSAQFSPDGRRIVTASVGRTARVARVWDVGPIQSKYPDWLLPLAVAISGRVLNKQGVLEETKLTSTETITWMRAKLSQESGDDDWVVWGRWFLADPSTRTISPFSKISAPPFIENQIKDGDLEALEEAERLALGNAELLHRISEARKPLEQIKQAEVLQEQAEQLRQDGKRAEAETALVEALALARLFWTNDPARWADSIGTLTATLQRQGRKTDLEQLINDVVTPALDVVPRSASLLRGRADFFGRRRQWREAGADLSMLLELEPSDHRIWYQLAPVLVVNGDAPGYRRQCTAMLVRWEYYEHALAACLLLPMSGTDLTEAGKFAEAELAPGNWDTAWREFVRGLAEFRQGRFASTLDWMNKSLAKPAHHLRDAQACFVLAMAHHQLNQATEARAALAKGREIAETKLPRLKGGDLGDSWQDYLTLEILLREANTLLADQAGTEKK